MQNQKIRDTLIQELGIQGLPADAQDQIVSKLGEIILKSLTVSIFENLDSVAREEFEHITASNDSTRIQDFLEEYVPNLNTLMEEEVHKALKEFAKNEAIGLE